MKKTFKILSIDGGGIKGLYSATILASIEKENGPIAEHFNMICGTSTGGIIALGLAAGISAQEIAEFYKTKGTRIFPYMNRFTRSLAFWRSVFINAKYSSDELKKCLTEVFQDLRIKDLKTIVLIPTVNLTIGEPVVIKSDHQNCLTRDNNHRIVDVAVATCSAPTYFPIATMETMKGQLIDGGIWANNPSLLGIIEALKYYVGEGKQYERFKLLSVSSIRSNNGWSENSWKSRSIIKWAKKLVPVTMEAQSLAINNYINHLIDCINGDYIRIESPNLSPEQAKVVDLDKADSKAINTILTLAEGTSNKWNTDPKIKDFFKEAV